MTEALEKLGDDFRAFREECIKLRGAFNTYLALYASGDSETDAALTKAACWFFEDLNEWLIELIILRIGRLTDPAGTYGRQNLSVCWVVEEVGKAGKLTPEIDSLVADLTRYREIIKPARNRMISHSDVRTFREGVKLGAHSQAEVEEFFENLQNFTDDVGRAIGVGPLDYRTQAGPGDVGDLIHVLKRCALNG